MTKEFKSLSAAELIVLTDEDLDRYVKLDLLHAGVKIPVQPVEPIYQQVPEPDVTAYTVEGFDGLFTSNREADAVASLIGSSKLKISSYEYSVGYEFRYAKEYFKNKYGEKSITVSSSKLYSEALFKDITSKLSANKFLKDDYEKLEEEYKKDFSNTSEIHDSIYDKYSEALTRYNYLEGLKERFEQYLSLADGDEEQALKFFKNAYAIDDEEAHYIRGIEFKEVVESENLIQGVLE